MQNYLALYLPGLPKKTDEYRTPLRASERLSAADHSRLGHHLPAQKQQTLISKGPRSAKTSHVDIYKKAYRDEKNGEMSGRYISYTRAEHRNFRDREVHGRFNERALSACIQIECRGWDGNSWFALSVLTVRESHGARWMAKCLSRGIIVKCLGIYKSGYTRERPNESSTKKIGFSSLLARWWPYKKFILYTAREYNVVVRNYILYVSVCYVFTRLIIWAARASSFFPTPLRPARPRVMQIKRASGSRLYLLSADTALGEKCVKLPFARAAADAVWPFQFSTWYFYDHKE